MFKKLLKYDMMAVWRLWWLAVMIVPIASVVGSVMLRFIITGTENGAFEGHISRLLFIGALLSVFACIVAIVLSFILTMVLIYVRFYKNLFTDEGYLTFTLPVSRKQILLSKTLNAFIWYVLHGLLIGTAIFLFILFAVPPEGNGLINTEIFKVIGEMFVDLWNIMGAWLLVILAELIIFILLSTLMGIALFHISITVGSVIAKKAKILASVGIYYVFNMVLSLLSQISIYVFIFLIGPGLSNFEILTDAEGWGMISLLFVIGIAFVGVITALLYNLTQHLLDRKLNLA